MVFPLAVSITKVSLDTVSNTLEYTNGGTDQANNNGGAVNNAITVTEDDVTTEQTPNPERAV